MQGNPSKHIFHIQEDNTRVDGFTLTGKPIMIDNGNHSGIVINNNTFNMAGNGPDYHGITFTTTLSNSTFSNNTFNINDAIGVYGYYWNNLKIANNNFLNGNAGMHLDNLDNNGVNLTIEQNYFSGIEHMGVEYQSYGRNTILQDNWFEKPHLSSNFSDNNNSFAFSIVADKSTGTIARRNVIYAPERPDGVGVRIGFETGGDNTLVENNYVYGINQVLANTDGVGSTSCLARNNYYSNTLDGLVGRGLTQQNNGSQVDLNWLKNRGPAGRNTRFTDPGNPSGGKTSTSSTPTTATTSSVSSSPMIGQDSSADYLSNMNASSSTNGWGPFEKDKSNGENGSGDGRTITLNGQTYAKGLGVHANSDITYNINGQYSRFFSDVGVDDETGSAGSIVFQVYVDGAKVYDSGTMNSGTATKNINLDVTGKSTLRLVVNNNNDGSDHDHGDWANARLSRSSSAPTSTATANAWVGDLGWSSMTNAWGSAERNKSNGEMGSSDGRTITINGTTYAKGVGTNADSTITYNLAGKYKTFNSDVGVDDEVGNNGSVIFRVYADGVLKYDSGLMRGSDGARKLSVSIAGANELKLVVTNGGDGSAFDHADWAGAQLLV